MNTTADVEIQQTFAFDDSEQQFIKTVRDGEDPSHDWGSYSDVDLARWLERPILATTKIWEVGQPFPQIYFNPWSAFLDSPSVAQKLSNFYLLRCKMHMKVMVNGSQMHYGRGFVSYRPLMTEPGERYQFVPGAFDQVFASIDYDGDSVINLTNAEEVTIMTQSQWPKIFVDPGQSMGGEMEFPFFYGANWFRIPYRDWVANPSAVETGSSTNGGEPIVNMISDTVPCVAQGPYGARVSHMGVVHSSSLAPLKHANGADDPVTIQVFLWATDVKFSLPTAVPHPSASSNSLQGTFIPQMRSEYVPNFLGDLAKSSSPDIAGRLEVGQSSLKTDESTVGLGISGEMDISALAKREVWLDRFVWRVDEAAETPLWFCKVTPQYFKRQLTTSPNISNSLPCLQPTPSAYAALPFGYWRGSMKYRIQIVASNLHRGRLRIVYDPVADVHARGDVNFYPESLMNQQYSRTIDIAGDSGRDFVFEVGYMQEKPYLSLLPLEQSITDPNNDFDHLNYGPNVPVPDFPQNDRVAPTQTTNGQVTIYVLNRLAIPATGVDINNDVTVNVYSAAGDDMDFQMPTSRNLNVMSFVPPTGYPTNWRNDAISQSLGNEALRRITEASPKEPIRSRDVKIKSKKKVLKATEGTFIPQMDTGESASMGATEMENVPEEPPTKAWMGDCSQPASTMSSVTFGEKFVSWKQLMDRWQLYNRETFTKPDSPFRDSPTRGDDEYSVLTIIPNFPPFPGPAPMNKLWDQNTSWFGPGLATPTQGPFVAVAATEGNEQLALNFSYNVAPAAKYFLNAPVVTVPEPDTNFVDSYDLLKVNPGQLTMMHFVTRMFIGRKGAIRNKYVLDGNKTVQNGQGTQIMSVKRLPDTGAISGNTWLSPTSSAQNRLDTNAVQLHMPAYGGFWSQASCRVENASNASGTGLPAPGLAKAQALNGSILTGASKIAAPNWYDSLSYPSSGDYNVDDISALASPEINGDMMMTNTFDGVHVTTTRQQPVIEVEIPFYVNSRFIKNDLVLNNTRGVQAHVLRYESTLANATIPEIQQEAGSITYVERHVRPGSDFALYYLANVPHIVLCGNFRYQTVIGSDIPGDFPPDIALSAYGRLRYRARCGQSESAYRELGQTDIPLGTTSLNTYPQDVYFYDKTIQSQIYPLNQPVDTY